MNNLKLDNGIIEGLSKLRTKSTVLCFSAHWCGDCIKHVPPLIAAFNRARNSGIVLAIIDVDQNKRLAQQTSITAIPTMIVCDMRGIEVARVTENPSKGFKSIEEELFSILSASERFR